MPVGTPLRAASLRIAAVLLASVLAASTALAAVGDLYVTSDAINKVNMFSGTSGVFQSLFTPSVNGLGEMAIHFGATNGRVLVGSSGGGVDEFNASTGAFIKTYNPGGGWQWGAVYAPNGDVLIGDMSTQDIRRYDSNTGAFISVFQSGLADPADMEYGPSGHLWVCSFSGAKVYKLNPNTGAIVGLIPLPPFSQANDIGFNPANNEYLISDMRLNVVYRYDATFNLVGSFAGTGWGRPHGIAISPYTGHVLVVDGVTAQVHEFDPVTYTEITPAFLSPAPGLKIVDLAFRPGDPTPTRSTSWGRVKSLYR